MPTIVLATVGSLGDLHPFIALGLALRARGATVIVATAADYAAKVERAGLEFRPARPSFEELERTLGMNRAELTRSMLARNDFLLRRIVMPYVRASYDDMLSVVADADLVLTSTLAFGARMAAERRGVPFLAVVLQPMMFLSAFDPPRLPQAEWATALLERAGPTVTGWALALVKRVLAAQLQPVQALRAAEGMAEVGDPLFEGQFGVAGALALYSPLLGAVQPDYPEPTAVVGFAPFDSDDGAPATLDAALAEFLAAGSAPLVFTLGSLIVNSPGGFYRESLAAVASLGCRAVLLVGEAALPHYAGLESADLHVAAYAPHSLLFPAAAAIVHQGGIGTLAAALRSGRPQLVVPHYADQFDNACRARRLGVARVLKPQRYRAAAARRELTRLLASRDLERRALEVGRAVAAEDGASAAAALIWQNMGWPAVNTSSIRS